MSHGMREGYQASRAIARPTYATRRLGLPRRRARMHCFRPPLRQNGDSVSQSYNSIHTVTMSLRSFTRRRLAVIVCVGVAASVGAQQAPTGTYRSRTVTLELTPAGQARFSNASSPLIVASYVVTGDSITFRDESGPAACPIGAGRYLWRLEATTMEFRLVSDPCDARRTLVAMTWTRGARSEPLAAGLTPVV